MPILNLTVPENSFDAAQKARLLENLTVAAMTAEGLPDTPAARMLTWVLLHEVKPENWAIGGKTGQSFKSLVRVTVPQGGLSEERKQQMAATVFQVLSESLNDKINALETIIVLDEIPDGNFSAGGKTFRLREIASFIRN